MTYDKKHVTPSFRNALSDVLGIKKEQALEEMAAGKPGPKRAAKIADGKVDAIKPWEHKTNEETELTEDELTEEEIFDILAEEFTPHIEKLIDEGFTDEEITELIVEMINTEEDKQVDQEEVNGS